MGAALMSCGSLNKSSISLFVVSAGVSPGAGLAAALSPLGLSKSLNRSSTSSLGVAGMASGVVGVGAGSLNRSSISLGSAGLVSGWAGTSAGSLNRSSTSDGGVSAGDSISGASAGSGGAVGG